MLSLYLFYACFWQKRYKLYIIISPNLFLGGRRGVWCRVLCGELHTHNTFRVADIPLSCKGNLCDYADRAYN